MNVYLGLAFALAGAALQATVLQSYSWLGVHVDLVVISVAGWAALRRVQDGILWAILGGLALDIFSAGPVGASALALVVASSLAWLVGHRLRTLNLFLVIAAVPLATLTYYLVLATIFWMGGASITPFGLVVGVIGPALLLDSLVGAGLVLFLAWLSHSITPSPWAPK